MADADSILRLRFWSKAQVSGNLAECWPWMAQRDKDGYGRFWLRGISRVASRVAWRLANGVDVPAGIVIRHSCDNPPCVNPLHLLTGTNADNTHDAMHRGRLATGERSGTFLHPELHRGERHGMAKLTEAGVRQIRERLKAERPVALAREFHVTPETIYMVRSRKLWRHVE